MSIFNLVNLFDTIPNHTDFYSHDNTFDKEETETTLTFYLDLPGCKKEDIKITFQEATLYVDSTRHAPEGSKQLRQYGKSKIRLDGIINVGNPVAEYENGVLTITFTKTNASNVEVSIK